MNITVNPQYIKSNIEQSVDISWDSVENAEKYVLERTVDGNAFATIYEGTELSYTDMQAYKIKGMELSYRVKSVFPISETPTKETPTEISETTVGGETTDGSTTEENTTEPTPEVITEIYSETVILPIVTFWVNDGILYPFETLINFKESDIPSLPEIIDETSNVSGTDGDVSLSTRYGARTFGFFGYSKNFNSDIERDNSITFNAKILHSTKNKAKYLMYKDKLYKVKVSDRPNDSINPLWYSTTINLKAHNPYGYSVDENIQYMTANESYTVENNGDNETYPTIIVSGACNAPKFTVNGIEYLTENTFAMNSNDLLEIDCERSTAILNKGTDREENAMKYFLADKFPKFEIGENTISSTADCKFKWRERSVII